MGDKPNIDQSEMSQTLKTNLEENEEERSYVVSAPPRGWGIRHIQAAVMTIATTVAFSLRINLSVAIVAMVRYKNETSSKPELAEETYEWGEDIQGYLLSSFFWGYMLLQVPAGIITEKFGGHRFLCFSILGSSLLTLLLPQCAYIGGWFLVCMNRMLQGICQGFVFPSIFTLLGVWAPPLERSTLTSMALGGQLLGTVATTPISGYLSALYGWPSVFYFFGGTGVILGLVVVFLGSDSPAKNSLISDAEKQYIESSLGGAKVQMKVPWKYVLSSPAYWSTLISSSFQALVFLMLLTKIPTYLKTVLNFSIKDSGVLSALPYLVAYLLSFVYPAASDFLTNRGYVSLTVARKIFNSIAHFGSSICIVLMAHSGNRIVSVFLLTALMGSKSASFTGATANFVDMAPNFSGTIFSLANFSAATLGLFGPVIVGFIVTEAGNVAQWRIVFYICASGLTLSNILYVFLGSAKTQWWNWPDKYADKESFNKESEKKIEIMKKADIRRLSLVSNI